jgi:hypothetical protein
MKSREHMERFRRREFDCAVCVLGLAEFKPLESPESFPNAQSPWKFQAVLAHACHDSQSIFDVFIRHNHRYQDILWLKIGRPGAGLSRGT